MPGFLDFGAGNRHNIYHIIFVYHDHRVLIFNPEPIYRLCHVLSLDIGSNLYVDRWLTVLRIRSRESLNSTKNGQRSPLESEKLSGNAYCIVLCV